MMTRKQLCDRWNVSLDTVDRLVKRGQLHPVKIGRLVRFREDDVSRYEEDNQYSLKLYNKDNHGKVVRVIV